MQMNWLIILVIIFWFWTIVDLFLIDIAMKKLNNRLDEIERKLKTN
jgi:hypothetical protein